MRNILFLFSLWLGFAACASGAENLTLADGTSLPGEIVKFDDNGLMIHLPGDIYITTNVGWSRLSQDSLKQLAKDTKLNTKKTSIASLVEPFIDPDESQRPSKPEIKLNSVQRLALPADSSVLGGLARSSVGLFIFLLLYAANLYAGFEVAVLRGRPIPQVMGLAAVLPVIGPIVFLSMPVKLAASLKEEAAQAAADSTAAAVVEEIQIAQSSWKQEETKKVEPQIFPRGKFTFNRRFIETKFAAFMGAAQGEAAQQFTMEVTTVKDRLAVVRITQVAAEAMVMDAVQRGSVSVPFADIQEIKLNPKTA